MSASTRPLRRISTIPRANGPSTGGGIAQYTFGFDQQLHQDYAQGRLDYQFNASAAGVRALHLRRRRPGSAHRLPAVPASIPVAQPVLHRRAPVGAVVLDAQHDSAWLQPDPRGADRRGQHVHAPPALRRGPPGRRHRRGRTAALRPADLGRRQAHAERLRAAPEPGAHARASPAQSRVAGGVLPDEPVQPDIRARHLQLHDLAQFPREPPRAVHRPDARRRAGPLLALDTRSPATCRTSGGSRRD